MICNGHPKKTAKRPILVGVATVLAITLIFPWVCYAAEAQTGTPFTRVDNFSIPELGGVSTIRFNVSGSYTQASLENGAWKFVGLTVGNFSQQGKLYLTVSAQDSNVTITSYRVTNATDSSMGSVRLSYVVEGNGTQTFNFGAIPIGGYWSIIFHRVYMSEHDFWDVSPDGTLSVRGAASGTDVNIIYYTLPSSVVDALSQPFYVQHSVAIATGVGMLIVVAFCLAFWRRNLKVSLQNQSLPKRNINLGGEMTATRTDLVVKGRLRSFGDCVLEFTGSGMKFYVETGRFRKRSRIIREIPLADVENVERQGNDLSIARKDTADVFVAEKASQAEPIYERITAALKELKKEQENRETAIQQQNELAQMVTNAMDAANSLFDILKSLHGRVDWKLVENGYKQAEETIANLANQSVNSIRLDINPLSEAVQKHSPEETAEKTYDVLKALHNHFDRMASSAEASEQSHPNRRDAKLVMQAIYVVNDMALGAVVGDVTVQKKGGELLTVLGDLSKLPGSKIDANAFRTAIDGLSLEKEKQRVVIEEIMPTLQQQLKELIGAPTGEKPRTNKEMAGTK
jgi:hypothetical protein